LLFKPNVVVTSVPYHLGRALEHSTAKEAALAGQQVG